MSWKAYEYDSRKEIGTYPTEMDLAALRKTYAPGDRFIVENDDGSEFEAFVDTATLKIVSGPRLAETENNDMYDDPGYRPSD